MGRQVRLRHAASSTSATSGFQGLSNFFGFGNYFYSYSVYSISSNDVAAFPSLHAAYPFLAFLFARRAFGKAGWLMLAYTASASGSRSSTWASTGSSTSSAASSMPWRPTSPVMHGPAWARRFMNKIADEEIEAGVEAEEEGESGALAGLGRRIRWSVVCQGLVVALVGAALAALMDNLGWLGGPHGALYLLPWLGILGGLWRSAAGLISR